MGKCDSPACAAATFSGVPVASMSATVAARWLGKLVESHRGESWAAMVLQSHLRHVS